MSFLAISAPHVRGTAPHLDAGAPAHALLAQEHAHFRPPPHDLGGIVWPVHAPDPLDADSPRHPQRVPFSLVEKVVPSRLLPVGSAAAPAPNALKLKLNF